MFFSYHTIYLFISFFPMKFNEAYSLVNIRLMQHIIEGNFPRKRNSFFLAKFFIFLLEKKINWDRNTFKKKILMRQIDRDIYIVQ
jgi:hypothetical protein